MWHLQTNVNVNARYKFFYNKYSIILWYESLITAIVSVRCNYSAIANLHTILTKLSLKLKHGWLITHHWFTWLDSYPCHNPDVGLANVCLYKMPCCKSHHWHHGKSWYSICKMSTLFIAFNLSQDWYIYIYLPDKCIWEESMRILSHSLMRVGWKILSRTVFVSEPSTGDPSHMYLCVWIYIDINNNPALVFKLAWRKTGE